MHLLPPLIKTTLQLLIHNLTCGNKSTQVTYILNIRKGKYNLVDDTRRGCYSYQISYSYRKNISETSNLLLAINFSLVKAIIERSYWEISRKTLSVKKYQQTMFCVIFLRSSNLSRLDRHNKAHLQFNKGAVRDIVVFCSLPCFGMRTEIYYH